MKALLPPNEAGRLRALARYEILDTEPQRDFDDITLLASQVCGTPIALICLVDGNRQWFKSKIGMTESEMSRDIAFCAHGILEPDLFEVEDALADERFATNPLVTGNPKIRFYAGSPLVTPDGYALGMLCVMDQVPRKLSPAQKAALKALSRQVVAQLELRSSLKELRCNLSERARAKEELRKSEKLFAAFMSHWPGFAWMKDLEGRYTYANAMLAQLQPYREGWLGKTDVDLWPAEIASAVRANDETVIATAKPLQAIEQYLRDNEVSQVFVSKFPIFDSIGAVEMVGGASIDITEKKQAEKALAEQVLRYRTLMETSTDSIYVIDTSGNLQEANAEFLRRRGYSAAEAKGLNMADWAQWTREELQERAGKLIGSNAVFETRHRCKDGSVFDVEVGVTSVQLADKQLFFCVTREITERKKAETARRESEERFRQIAENINEVFWVWTATPGKPRILYVSPAYETIWGRSCESLYSLPQSWKEALHPNDKEWVLAQIADLDLEKMNDLTYRIVRPDRSIRWIRDRIFPVRDGRDVVIRFAGIAEDITERKLAEDRLEHSTHLLQTFSRRLLKVQEEERRHLARELHDEIGQTLTAAKLNLQSATGDGGSVTSARLQETTAILDRLLSQVRQMSLDLRPSMLDDLGLVPALRSLLNQQGRRASVAVRFSAEDVPDKLDSEIQTTCFRIGQEGITNAVRHAGATQINVDLRCANGELRLLICDNGIGFDAESVRAQTAGLGLIGIKERAALLDGRAKITSSLNKGTTIEISLPLTFRRARKSRPTRK